MAGAGFAGILLAKKKVSVGVQLYSVRAECAKDLPGTLAGVAKLGFKGVEFAGYWDRTAPELRKLLDANGLACCGTHINVKTLLGDELPKTVEFNKIIGNKNLIVPSINGKTLDDWREHAKTFNEIAAKLKPQGLRVGYHNHAQEFKPIDGKTPWDVLFGSTTKDVIMQLDIGHCLHGGGDPVQVLKTYKGRAKTVHVKDYSPAGPEHDIVGTGDMKWPQVLDACEKDGGTEWYIIEEESGKFEGLDGIAKSLAGLHKFGR